MEDKGFIELQDGIIEVINDMCNIKYNGRKMSINRLAKFSGVSRSCLNSIVQRETDCMNIKTLWKLCKASGISLSDLFADIEEAASRTKIERADPVSLDDLAMDNPYIKETLAAFRKSIQEYELCEGNQLFQSRLREEAIVSCKLITGYLKALEDLEIISSATFNKLVDELSVLLNKISDNFNSRLVEELQLLLKGEDND